MTDISVSPLTVTVKRLRILHLEYEVWHETGQAHYIKALHTGAVRKFRTCEALNEFIVRLTWFLSWKYAYYALPAPRLSSIEKQQATMMQQVPQTETPHQAWIVLFEQRFGAAVRR